MKVKFKLNCFGPSDFKGEGYFAPSGQRFKKGMVYNLSEEILKRISDKNYVVLEDGLEKTAEQFNKEKALQDLEDARLAEVAIENTKAGMKDKMAKARAVANANRAKKKAAVTNETHGVE